MGGPVTGLGWVFVLGVLTTILGAIGWYTRKPVEGGSGVGYESIEAAISPYVTATGILMILAVVLDWTGIW
jgi:hypothetical protein